MVVKDAPSGLIRSAISWFDRLRAIDCFVCGGFVRAYYAGENPRDMDIYFRNMDDYNFAMHTVEEAQAAYTSNLQKLKVRRASETENAVTWIIDGKCVQFVKKFMFGDIKEIIDSFDFSICACGLDVARELVYFDDDFFEHLAARVLVFRGSLFPLSSMSRAFKYVKRGYHICDENIISIVKEIVSRNSLDAEVDSGTQITGVDPDGRMRIRPID